MDENKQRERGNDSLALICLEAQWSLSQALEHSYRADVCKGPRSYRIDVCLGNQLVKPSRTYQLVLPLSLSFDSNPEKVSARLGRGGV